MRSRGLARTEVRISWALAAILVRTHEVRFSKRWIQNASSMMDASRHEPSDEVGIPWKCSGRWLPFAPKRSDTDVSTPKSAASFTTSQDSPFYSKRPLKAPELSTVPPEWGSISDAVRTGWNLDHWQHCFAQSGAPTLPHGVAKL